MERAQFAPSELPPIVGLPAEGGPAAAGGGRARTPEDQVAARGLAGLLERAIDGLPGRYREAFVLREVEGMRTAEAAQPPGVTEDAVKARLHRAKVLLQGRLTCLTEGQLRSAFAFEAPRCDRVVFAVMAAISRAR
jgi:RNA polymerase sigma-70 factor (ECF subfamily)